MMLNQWWKKYTLHRSHSWLGNLLCSCHRCCFLFGDGNGPHDFDKLRNIREMGTVMLQFLHHTTHFCSSEVDNKKLDGRSSVAPPKRKSLSPGFELLRQCYIIPLPLPVSPWTEQTRTFQLPTLHGCLGLCALCFQILMLELHWPVRWYLEMGSLGSSPDRINALIRKNHRKPFPLSLPCGDVVRVSILTNNGPDRQLNLGLPIAHGCTELSFW